MGLSLTFRRVARFGFGLLLVQGLLAPSSAAGLGSAGNRASPLGTNLAQVTDFTAEVPFADHFKQARFWISGNSRTFEFDDGRSFRLDANGNILSLKADQVGRAVLFTGLPADPQWTGKKMIVRYEGDGDLAYSGRVSLLSHAPGRDVIQLLGGSDTEEATTIINLTRTNPVSPLKSIRLTPFGGICRSDPLKAVAQAGACNLGDFRSFEEAAVAGEVFFNPAFLNSIKTYRSVRFMDWQRTNDSSQTVFPSRALTSHQFWSTDKGVPLEAIIALANLLDLDPWVNIPHLATDAYVRSLAALLRDQLKAGLRAHVEYSNETWNGIFVQSIYVQDKGEELGLNLPENNRFIGGLRFYSLRSQQIFDAFERVFGAQRASRVRRVMATQAVNPFLTQTILKFGKAAKKTDAFAIAPYFGDTIVEEAKANEIKRLGVDGVFDWLLNDNNAILDFGSLASLDRAVEGQKSMVQGFGLPLITYEGGQHFLAAGGFQNDAALNAIMDSVNADPRIKQIYLSYLGLWRQRSAEVFWHYLNVDRWSRFGRWGSKQFANQTRAQAPKFDGLQTYIEQQPLP
jgi:hypothetical protein